MRKVFVAGGVAILFLLIGSSLDSRSKNFKGDVLAGPATQTCDIEPANDYKQEIRGLVDGDELVLTVSARFGGAVESVTWRGKEFINIFDHGRQISYAWGMDGYGECFNPTEPGSASDLFKNSSTSELLSVCKEGESSLTTTTNPAFWLAPGEGIAQGGFCDGGVREAVNDTLVSEQILEKNVQIGYGGIDNVIVFNASITLQEDYRSNQLEIPTGYLTYEFNDYWVYNPQSGELVEPESDELQEPWSFTHYTKLPVILATPDGEYAMGAYTAEDIEIYSILFYDIPNPADRTNKWNIVIREEPAPAGVYTYQTFAVVGTLEEVQAAMSELYRLHPTDFKPPEGYVDVANCQEIAGWAWDPKAPNQPIDVEIYDVSEEGVKTLLATVTADMLREDLPPVLGDNGEHGYRVLPSEVLLDGQRYTLRVEAVNSVEGLDNRALIPSEQVIECPELEPELTEEVSTQVVESEAIVEEEPVVTSEDSRGGVLPCLGGLLPLVVGAVGLWGRRRREW
ncbi:MAG: hypothetical protein DWQ07_22120 [Chloroflexi bacterium]|nr:MAG: hypothetical protein DWQ07_22120 [Chloroflexota bacterium]MBL1196348.1 hypothetical protein [Chloroflexota bacterium]NOH13643.1 hypothetical protein [Chloroflexota bacterium]